jgi:hypothetical protein
MKKGQKYIMIIGGIEVFLQNSPMEARECVADATKEEGHPTVTIIEEEEVEQVLIFSPAKEEHVDKMLAPWELELEMSEDWLNNLELVYDFHVQTVMQIAGEEHLEELLKNFFQGVEQKMTAVLRSAAKDDA